MKKKTYFLDIHCDIILDRIFPFNKLKLTKREHVAIVETILSYIYIYIIYESVIKLSVNLTVPFCHKHDR